MDWLLSADVLWMMIRDPTLTPGKIYEYMGTRRPILALADEGIVRTLLDSYGAGLYVRPDDIDGISDAIESLYEAWLSGILPVGDEDMAEAHNVRNLSRQLEIILSHAMRL
jgi:glycosyltransferase involved in cell wall biosynthesis